MKLSCSRSALASAFSVVSGVVPSRTTKDILKNVKVQVAGGAVTLQATDTEIGMKYTLMEAQSESVGEFLLPASRTGSILKELIGDTVTFDVEDQLVTIQCGQSKFKLPVESADGFPDVTEIPEGFSIKIPAKDLKQQISRTIFATDDESTRYALGGVLFEVQDNVLKCVSTDGRRMALAQCACEVTGTMPAGTKPVIPGKALQLINRSVNDLETVEIRFQANEILVQSTTVVIYSRLIEGRFPNYKDVIPPSSKVEIDFVCSPLYSAIRQSMIVTNEETRGVDFRFNAGELTLISKAADIGESTIQVPISYDGEELIARFDPRYLADFLRVLDQAATIQLKLISGDDPAVFLVGDEYKYVMMPLSRS
jgi:DNA polymerase-3 subunit beta